MGKRIGQFVFVTIFAIHLAVLSFQREIRAAMVKALDIADGCKRELRVAILTSGAQFTLMDILMTVGTGVKGDPGKGLKIFSVADTFWMAFLAIHLLMLAFQGKACFVVSESGSRFKCFEVMAAGTVQGQGLLVIVLVTVLTIRAQAKVSELLFAYDLALDES
jgi:hypothetical protein